MIYPVRGLRFRLAAVYLVWFGALLAAGAVLLWIGLERSYLADVDRTLAQTFESARSIYTVDRPEFPVLEARVAHIIEELIYADRAILAIDTRGRVIASSRRYPGAPTLDSLGPKRFPKPETVQASEGPARVETGELDAGVYLMVGISLEPLERQRRALRYILLAGLPILLLASAAVGVVAARPALRPIGEVAEAAKRTGALIAGGAQEFPPIPGRAIHDEVGDLTAEFNRLLTRLSDSLRTERAEMERQRDFLADVAHQLRTPVAIVLSEAEAALTKSEGSGDEAEALERIAEEARHMGLMVGDLLLLARGEAGFGAERKERFFLDDVASHVVMRATRLPEARGRSIQVGRFEAAPVRGSKALIERAILALVENALVHTTDSPVEMNVGVSDGRAWLEVRDWGAGITPDEAEHVFKRFARGGSSAPGSGLGLAIARWIAERHGGKLTYQAPPGGGAGFFMELPADQA